MSRLIEAMEREVASQELIAAEDVVLKGEIAYPDYSDYSDHSDSGGWSDGWSDGPTHSDSWGDSGWPYK